MRIVLGRCVGLLALFYATGALAFGTATIHGQNAEHERITRHALACADSAPSDICFQAASINELAGQSGTFGAVGAPDDPVRGLMLSSVSHCDNGDYVAVPGYPNTPSAAQAMLWACRGEMMRNLYAAVADSAALLYSDNGIFHTQGNVDDSQIPTLISCTYLGVKGRAKCNVLEDLGLLLHGAEDFYSHSNWVDQAAPGPITLSNPRGLGNAGIAPWLDLRNPAPAFPAGLITGCFDTISLASPSSGCPGHVKHDDVNKDEGQIDPSLGAGTTNRGKIGNNFALAVTFAELDARDKVRTFKSLLEQKYGTTLGDRMFCAVTHDDAVKSCNPS